MHIRQMMLACRRIQPIPQDFDHALKRSSLRLDDLALYMTPVSPQVEPIPTSPPIEPDSSTDTLSFLGPELSGQDDRAKSAYIPKHFPKFPSRHTYRHTPVFAQREQDARKIREQVTEDGRHGEEALRKLARAASQDTHVRAVGRGKKLWGRKMESMDSMFEKTVKGLSKRLHKNASATVADVMDEGPLAEQELRPTAKALVHNFEVGPAINCDRDLWRRTTASGMRGEERPNNNNDDAVDDAVDGEPHLFRVDSWVTT